MSKVSAIAARAIKEQRIISSHIWQFALPGLLTAIILLCMSLLGVPGAKAAAHDLWEHAWKLHPLLWTAAGLVTTSVVLFQNGDFAEDVDRATLPLLHFFAHALSFSAAAVALLGWTMEMPWADSTCGKRAGLALLTLVFLLMATVAVAGVLIVERRSAARITGVQDELSTASKLQLRGFPILVVFFFILVVYACIETGDTKTVVKKWLGHPANAICSL